MVSYSPPTISLSSANDEVAQAGSSAPNIPNGSRKSTNASSYSISPALLAADTPHRDLSAVSPYNSALLEPQASSFSEDVFNLSADLLNDYEYRPAHSEIGEPVNISSSLLSSHSAAAAAGSAGSNSCRRARSGSLFSTNSIWNDDALPSHSPDRSISSGGGIIDPFSDMSIAEVASSKPSSSNFLSPNLVPQASPFGIGSQSRNRSHTTSGSIQGSGAQKLDPFRTHLSPNMQFSHDDPSSAIENLHLNPSDFHGSGNRNRSQTYSGAQPKIFTSAIPNMMAGASVHPSINAAQALPNFPMEGRQSNTQRVQPVADPSFSIPGSYAEPYLQDDFNFANLAIITNFENPSLGPTNTLLLDNVPLFFDAAKLYRVLSNPNCSSQGYHNRGVLSVRLASTSTSKMALVVCPSVEVAMNLKANFNHLEIVPGATLYVAFAKVTERIMTDGFNASSTKQTAPQGDFVNEQKPRPSKVPEPRQKAAPNSSTSEFRMIADSVLATCFELSGSSHLDQGKLASLAACAAKISKTDYHTDFGPLPETSASRQFDAPRIRELRKSLEASEKSKHSDQDPTVECDSKALSSAEINTAALDMLNELPELCYDHIGNTVVQKIFTVIESPETRLMMVKQILPYIASLGVHKNGTWAVQKIINMSQNDHQQKLLVARGLQPYSAKLFNDQFGNYVLQCCLKFGSPYNDFIFETICNNFIEISSGRFGVRCIRTMLETANDRAPDKESIVTPEQQVLVAGLIVEYANELVVNNNGSLLITWFLETFHDATNSIPDQRSSLLYEKFMPHLEMLCTHKLANATILKILSGKGDTSVRQKILDAIFLPLAECESRPPSNLLKSILKERGDNSAGPIFVQRLISSPTSFAIGDDESNSKLQQHAVCQVKRVLLEMQIGTLHPYKKLLDEVGLSNGRLSKASSGHRRKRGQGASRNSQVQPSYHSYGPHGFLQGYSGSHIPMPMGHNNILGDNRVLYDPYGQPFIANSTQANGARASYNGQYFGGGQVNMNSPEMARDAHVMRQLEQLSLQSAAMGYASNPGTPSGASSQNYNSYF
ncbi:hypothetical protein OXX59_003101 [Metschnikowia pulcherrima]